MLEIIGTRINLTRGDTAALHIEITREHADGTQTPYVMAGSDRLTLTAKKGQLRPDEMLKVTTVGSAVIEIRPEDTKKLPAGDYVYDIQLETAAGDVYTIIGPGTAGVNASMRLLPEVSV